MALPNNALSTPALPAAYLAPDDLGRPLRTEDYERGGIALSDPSQGLLVRTWRARVVGNELRIGGEPYTEEVVFTTDSGVTEISLALDQNMRPTLAWVAFNQAKLRWYDSQAAATVTTLLDPDVRSPYLTHDDKREFSVNGGTSDVVLLYIRGNRLCYRQQRERYSVERTLKWFTGNSVTIRRAGMNAGNRLQVELVGLQNKPLSRAFLGGWTAAAFFTGTTTISRVAPTVRAGDLLFAAVTHRSALTVPPGWTLVIAQAATNGTSQTLSILRENTPSPADSGQTFTFTQAGTGPLGAALFVVRSEVGTPSLLSQTAAVVNNVATNAITPAAPAATTLQGEIHVVVAMSINANPASSTPVANTGASLITGTAPEMRLAITYHLRDLGQSVAGSVAFDNGGPANNGLASVTLRFA